MSDVPTLSEITGLTWPNKRQALRVIARECFALRDRLDALEAAPHATNKRLDSHNRVMESIVRRVRVLEGAHVIPTVVGVDGPDLLLSDGTTRPSFKAFERIAELEQRAETAERERDAFREQHETCDRDRDRLRSDAAIARASVERLRTALEFVINMTGEPGTARVAAAALEDA